MLGRCLSGATASCSGRSALPLAAGPSQPHLSMRPCSMVRHRHSYRLSTRVAAAQQYQEDQDEEEMVPIKPSFFTLDNPFNREPDYTDPDWFEKVTDWDEFWNHTRWDIENEDNEEDDYDVSGNPTRTVDRAYAMLDAFKEIEGRGDVANLLTAQSRRSHVSVYDEPPVKPETQPELPDWDNNDWRAVAEKQRYKDLMDIEWKRRQSKVGQLPYPHKDVTRDVRMRAYDYMGETLDWTHDEMYSLITIGGTACRPEDHKAFVENPLVPVDFPNTMGVTHIEETEDFLARIGHLGVPKEMEMLSNEEIEDLLENSPVAEVAAELLEPTLLALETEQAKAQWRAEGNTWMGDT